MAQTPPRQSTRERFNISKLAIQYPWLTLGFWIAVMIAGLLAFSSLKYALFPDVTFPVVVVNAQSPLTSATKTETEVTVPIEAGVKGLEGKQGLTKIRSSTYPGRSVVSLSFEVGTKLEKATASVENALKAVKLPVDTDYDVTPINLNEAAVVSYAVSSSKQKLPSLTETVHRRIIPEITKVPGVLKVNLLGVPAGVEIAKSTEFKSGAEEVVLKPGSSAVRFESQAVLAFEVVKRSDANTLEVVDKVEQVVGRLQKGLPAVQLSMAATQAEYIHKATHSTIDALIEAIALSIIVMYPFLWNWKATIISALAIPTSLLGTFIVMAIFGFNLETITLLALALVIGIIVDDAIVDVENIMRHIENGKPPRQAVREATAEIGLTVTAATLTVVAVFLPVALMEGVIGQFFRPFGITVSAAVIISLLVARTLTPVLAAYWLRAKKQPQTAEPDQVEESSEAEPVAAIAAGDDAVADALVMNPEQYRRGFVGWYRNLLDWSLRHSWLVISFAILSFVAGIALIPFIQTGFIPKLDRGEFNVRYTAPLPALPDPATLARLAAQAGQAGASPTNSALPTQPPQGLPPGTNSAAIAAPTLPAFDPLKDSVDVAKQLEASVKQNPAVKSVFTTVGTRQRPNQGTLYVKLKDDRKSKTVEVQDQVRKDLPVLKDVSTSVEDIQFIDTGGEKPLQVVLVGNDPVLLSKIATGIQDRMEKLPGFADITITGGTNEKGNVNQIERVDGQRVAYLSSNLGKGVALGKATRQVEAIAQDEIKKRNASNTVALDRGSDSARVDEIFDGFKGTLALAVLCIMVVLVLLFKSLLDPLVVAISLPLSLVGALMPSLIFRTDFGMISIIGIILLLGLTNKSAILLVDYINQLRRAGMSRTEAILLAGPVRLRPILMTTASTILGMVPIALGLGAGAELRAPMATTIMGGLVTSTILSLLVIPVFYAVFDDFRQWFKYHLKRP
ncbi:MAG: efflux RND transporter permease subunit [Oscillatoriales cyanobacterium C42_A2020_001]|nr:efflux RND transporter permease subunit [Leptolyngbyaceae cyanobacterium C42_A2020_001]